MRTGCLEKSSAVYVVTRRHKNLLKDFISVN